MKKLITIFLSSIVCVGLWGQQTVPMTIAGDVYIASGAIMTSQGTVHLKADTSAATTAKAAKVANYGTLMMDTVIFYSNTLRDGLLMNQHSSTLNPTVTANAVIVRKTFTKSNAWHTMSFPFDINMGAYSTTLTTGGANVQYSVDGTPLVRGKHFQGRFYNAQRRADDGHLIDPVTGGNISYWEFLDNSEAILNKATGYQFAFKFSEVDGNYPASGNTKSMEIDFVTTNATQIADLLDKKAKSINLTHVENTTGGPYATTEYENYANGWNAVGGLNPTLFELRASQPSPTINFERTCNYWSGSSWAQYNPKDPTRQATLSPYAVFFVQSTKNELIYNPASGLGGILYNDNGLILSPSSSSVLFRSSQEEASEDLIRLQLAAADGSLDEPAALTYFCLSNSHNQSYNNAEDDIYQSSPEQNFGTWSLARSNAGNRYNALYTNCLPLSEDEIKLGFSVLQSGEYIFSLTECYNREVRTAVLWDKITDRKTDLFTSNYHFQTEEAVSNNEDRFVLFFNKSYTAIDNLQTAEIYAYTDNNVLTVKNLVSGDKVQIVDVVGRTIASGIASGNEFFVTLNQKGVYIVDVKGKKTLKVLNK